MPTLERLQYGFDRDSRRTWRRRVETQGFDQHFGYDGLSQVTGGAQGNLNLNRSAISGVPAVAEAWNYDPTGNWRGYHVDENGAVSLDQHRVHDKGNRLTQIEGDPNAILLDRAGRMLQVPPDAAGEWDEPVKLQYDAWSRITEVRRASDDTVLAKYGYDGLGRRTKREVDGVVHHIYYSDTWRPVEERKNDETTASVQYLWGARHRDDLVRRDRATGGSTTLNEKRYVLMDYYSPAAITDETGTVTERYAFSAFGVRQILAPDFSPRSTSECGFEFAFQGQFEDVETGYLNYGYRYYVPWLGRWTCKDPIGIDGGLNLYGMAENNAVGNLDYLGLEIEFDAKTVSQKEMSKEVGRLYSGFTGPAKSTIGVALPKEEGEDIIEESADRLCAKVVKAKTLKVQVRVRLLVTADALEKFTAKGLKELLAHEARRKAAYEEGNKEFLMPIEKAGLIATRCGEVKRGVPGEAKKALETYLKDSREHAVKKYTDWMERAQGDITGEKWSFDYGFLGFGRGRKDTILNPVKSTPRILMTWKPCP
jgi:RHS repeat-associated protein